MSISELFESFRLLFRRHVTVTFQNSQLAYDGLPHRASYKVEGLPEGYKLTPLDQATLKNATEDFVEVSASHYRILSPSGVDVTARFNIQTISGKMRIVPKTLKIKTGAAEKTWDGFPLRQARVQIDGICPNDNLAVTATGELTDVGSCENTCIVDWQKSTANPANYDLSFELGMLTINPASLRIVQSSYRVEYDGAPHPFRVNVPAGATLHIQDNECFVDAGVYERAFTVSMPNRTSYSGTAQLTILPRRLNLTTSSDEKRFDGIALSNHSVKVTGLVNGEMLEVRTLGSITEPGSVENPAEIDWLASTAKQQNYTPVTKWGTLTVHPGIIPIYNCCSSVQYDGEPHSFFIDAPKEATVTFNGPTEQTSVGIHTASFTATMPHCIPATGKAILEIKEYERPITVSVNHAVYEYDGSEHSPQVSVPSMPKGYRVVDSQTSTRMADVTQTPITATCDKLRIENSQGEDVTERLSIIFNDGSLEIKPRPLTVITPSKTKPFDGEPLIAPGELIGLCGNDKATLIAIGSQTEVGESINSYRIEFADETKAGNYRIIEQLGTLTVTPVEAYRNDLSEKHVTSPESNTVDAADLEPKRAEAQPVDWIKPDIRLRKSVSQAPTGAHRSYKARPVADRSDLENAGFGRSFAPSELPERDVYDKALRNKLSTFERRASDTIDDLLDKDPDSLICEGFSRLTGELNCLNDSFIQLFSCFSYEQQLALVWIDHHCRNAYLIWMSVLARDSFDGDSLWGKLFRRVGIRSTDIQTRMKRMFIAYTYQRKLFTFERNVNHTYIADTVLLHGGFSQASWQDLWKNVLLPLASQGEATKRMMDNDPYEHLLSTPSIRPRLRSTRILLENAPKKPMSSILSSAWKAASQIAQSDGAIELVDTSELPEIAILALEDALSSSTAANAKKGPRFIGGSRFDLQFDKAACCFRLAWNEERTIHDMAGFRIDIAVNGTVEASTGYLPSEHGYTLQGGSVELPPNSRYQIERRLMQRIGLDDGQFSWREVASSAHTISSSKPECFEFLQTAEGTFHARRPDEKLSRRRRTLFVVDKSRRIEGVRGMKLVDHTDGFGSTDNIALYEFDVEPGSAGLIVDSATGETITGWNEQYHVQLRKKHAIGTAGGIDLFGHILGTGETDVALPEICVDAQGKSAAEDVEVRYTKDGKRGSLLAQWDVDTASGEAILKLSFPTSNERRGIANQCVIEARQRSTGDILLRYRFAIAPIQGFRLEDYKIAPESKDLIGIYQFEATEPLTVTYSDSRLDEHLATGSPSFLEAPLSQEAIAIRMRDAQGKTLDAKLALAGISVALPDALTRRKQQVAYIGLPTIRALPFTAGDIHIVAKGSRYGRAVALHLGSTPLASKNLDKPGEVTVNIFKDESLFSPIDHSAYCPMPLTLSVSFGHRLKKGVFERATATYSVLECGKGMEFTDCRIAVVEGRQRLSLRSKEGCSVPTCKLLVSFSNKRGYDLGQILIKPGQRYADLPPEAEDVYSRQGVLIITIEMVGRFGKPDHSHHISLSIRRGR